MFSILVSDLEEAKSYTITLDNHPLVHAYFDVFLDEILGMPPQRGIDFHIHLILGVEPIS